MARKPVNYYIMKINRIVVWILLVFMLLLIITGYGLTRPSFMLFLTMGWLDYQAAFNLHTSLDVPFALLLIFHVVVEIKFSLRRWGFRNQKLLNLLMLMLAAAAATLVLYVDFLGG